MADNNQVHITDIHSNLTEVQIESSIEELIVNGSVDHPEDKYLLMAHLIGEIANCELLKKIVSRLRSLGLLKKRIGHLAIDNYSNIDKAKILASYYSLQLAWDYYEAMNRALNADIAPKYFLKYGLRHELLPLSFTVIDGTIHFNIFEVVKFIQRKITITDRLYADKQSPKERERFLNQCIADLNELWYSTGIDFYKTQIDYLKTVSVSPIETNVITALPDLKHESVFKNDGFRLFGYIMDNHVRIGRGRKADIAYYYGRMHKDKYIHRTPEYFKVWFQEKYPDEDYLGKFRPLHNLKDVDRDNKYLQSVHWFKTNPST